MADSSQLIQLLYLPLSNHITSVVSQGYFIGTGKVTTMPMHKNVHFFKNSFFALNWAMSISNRDRQRFFSKLGIKPCMYAFSGNKYFFTKSCLRHLPKPCQRSQNSDFQSPFSASKIDQIFPFFMWRIWDKETNF